MYSEWQSLSRVWLFASPWTIARQAPLSMEFSRQKYWSGLPFSSPEGPPDEDWTRISLSPALADGFLSTEPPWKLNIIYSQINGHLDFSPGCWLLSIMQLWRCVYKSLCTHIVLLLLGRYWEWNFWVVIVNFCFQSGYTIFIFPLEMYEGLRFSTSVLVSYWCCNKFTISLVAGIQIYSLIVVEVRSWNKSYVAKIKVSTKLPSFWRLQRK